MDSHSYSYCYRDPFQSILSASINVELELKLTQARRRCPCREGGQANQTGQQAYIFARRTETVMELGIEGKQKAKKGRRLGGGRTTRHIPVCSHQQIDTFDALLTQSHSICFGSLEAATVAAGISDRNSDLDPSTRRPVDSPGSRVLLPKCLAVSNV